MSCALLEKQVEPGLRELDEYVARRHTESCQYARAILRSWDDAEDAVQEAYGRAHRFRAQYDPRYPFAVWFRRILQNVCRDFQRKAHQRRRVPMPEGYEAVDDFDVAAECIELLTKERRKLLVEQAISSLPPESRVLLQAYYCDGLSSQDMGIGWTRTDSTIRVKLLNARREIHRLFPELGEDPQDDGPEEVQEVVFIWPQS